MLSPLQIKHAIENYLKRSFTQFAIMIDGGWGVGKTYLVEKQILPNVDQTRFFHISLFGLSTISDIEREIYKALSIDDLNRQNDQFDEHLTDVKMHLGSELGGITFAVQYLIKKIQGSMLESSKTLVFCFDDLERWNGGLEVCMAYINRLVELENIKCILIGNTDAFDESATNQLIKAREKSIRHIYKFENTSEEVIKIALELIDYQSASSKRFIRSLIRKNSNYLARYLNKISSRNIRSLSEALQLFEYVFVHNQKQFRRSERLSFTFLITLLATLVLIKRHFVKKHDREQLLGGNYTENKGFSMLKKLGYFDLDTPENINSESKILLDSIFYRLDEISLKGVFSIAENGFYIKSDFQGDFDLWHQERPYEKYLDKYFYYQLDEKEALDILESSIESLFEKQEVTNPVTLLLLSERILTDIQRDVINMDLEKTKHQFIALIEELYRSERMDIVDMEYLEVQEDRYMASNSILENTINLNAQYVVSQGIKDYKGFWERLAEAPNTLENLMEEFSVKNLYSAGEIPEEILVILERLTNSELYLLAQKLKDRNHKINGSDNLGNENIMSKQLAEEIYFRYKSEYNIRASNMKEIANILY